MEDPGWRDATTFGGLWEKRSAGLTQALGGEGHW